MGHLHSEEHKSNVKPPEIPWHDHIVNDEIPSYPNAPTKRTPIRGLQFFIPSTAWYCKLCSFWIGDLHCASSHLKSKTHAKNYDEFMEKNPNYENEWLQERQNAIDSKKDHGKETIKENIIVAPPPPPIISSQSQNTTVTSSIPFAANRLFDGIPLQINQRSKEISVSEDVSQKKSKKKKKEKKKKKKSKKKHHRHSSSSSSSSSSDEESSASVQPSPERKKSPEKVNLQPDTSTSIRVAMRNVPPRAHIKPKSDDDEETNAVSGWTVVQEAKAVAPKPPTISANGEAQNRRDEMIISQWNTPAAVISDKEKQLLEQLKGKLKNREESKKDKTPQPNVVVNKNVPASSNRQQSGSEKEQSIKRNDDDKKRRDEKDYDKDRRDNYRRRSRSPSPRRDR